MTKKLLKAKFDKTSPLMAKAIDALRDFHTASEEYFGFVYNDRDLDCVIDGVDYGGDMSWESYFSTMEEEKENES